MKKVNVKRNGFSISVVTKNKIGAPVGLFTWSSSNKSIWRKKGLERLWNNDRNIYSSSSNICGHQAIKPFVPETFQTDLNRKQTCQHKVDKSSETKKNAKLKFLQENQNETLRTEAISRPKLIPDNINWLLRKCWFQLIHYPTCGVLRLGIVNWRTQSPQE